LETVKHQARYNAPVLKTCAILLLVLSGASVAQQPTVPSCPANRPVDDIIAEVNKQQSKKGNRNKNPFPSVGCIWNWCRETTRTPPTVPEPAPSAPSPSTGSADHAPNDSSSKSDAERCNEAMEQALEAAHNVDVGDLQFEEKHYAAALSRYEEAAQEKSGDAAIHVRLGRVQEKLHDNTKAVEQYDVAAKIGTPEKWAAEARSASARLNASQK
jgi:tetratricopeptide (TPR) repeat protein